MAAITIMPPTLSDSGVSAALDIGTATSLRLDWLYNCGSPSQLHFFILFIESAPSAGGPWTWIKHSPQLNSTSGTYRMSAGGADQFIRARWKVYSSSSAQFVVGCSGVALP